MGDQVDILFTAHAMSRLEKWQITLEKTAAALLEPEEVRVGVKNRFIAHRCFGEHVLRAVYEYVGSIPTLVTDLGVIILAFFLQEVIHGGVVQSKMISEENGV